MLVTIYAFSVYAIYRDTKKVEGKERAGRHSGCECGRLIESLLFGVSPRDPAIFAGTATLLLGVALLACWIPARRAARLNPIDVLRS